MDYIVFIENGLRSIYRECHFFYIFHSGKVDGS